MKEIRKHKKRKKPGRLGNSLEENLWNARPRMIAGILHPDVAGGNV